MNHIIETWLEKGIGQKIFLLRHGEIQGADGEKRFIGQTDVLLSERGRHQAIWWRQRLADVSLARILSSDLGRCTETAKIIADRRGVAVEALSGLREILLGRWEGMSFRRVKERWPSAFQRRGLNLARFRPPDGESFKDLQQRVIRCFEDVINQAAFPILIVAHAGVNRMILCHVLKIPIESMFCIAQHYGGMNIINCKDRTYRVQAMNLIPPPENKMVSSTTTHCPSAARCFR